jgi:hypothetical protein
MVFLSYDHQVAIKQTDITGILSNRGSVSKRIWRTLGQMREISSKGIRFASSNDYHSSLVVNEPHLRQMVSAENPDPSRQGLAFENRMGWHALWGAGRVNIA